MRAAIRATLWTVVIVIAAAAPARAQSTGTIPGTVIDAQGAVVPGATIVIRHQSTGVERSVLSDVAGGYLAPSLPPGLYRVEAQLAGFRKRSSFDRLRTSGVD